MTFVRIRKFLIVLCAFVMCLCGGVALQLTSVSASAVVYLEVRPNDFALIYNDRNEHVYSFLVEYLYCPTKAVQSELYVNKARQR